MFDMERPEMLFFGIAFISVVTILVAQFGGDTGDTIQFYAFFVFLASGIIGWILNIRS